MSHTHRHYHAKNRWYWTNKSKPWRRHSNRRDEYAREVEVGIDEFVDTALYWDQPLDYVTEGFRHVWRAKEDRRHWGRRASDRARTFTRPSRSNDWTNLLLKAIFEDD